MPTMDADRLKRFKTEYYHRHEGVTETVVDALCVTYEQVTGKRASESIREGIYQAVRFDV
jgi:hypothetical protein